MSWRSRRKGRLVPSRQWSLQKTVVGGGLTQPTDKADNCITIGSDCDGLCSEGIAPELLSLKQHHKIACERNPSVRRNMCQRTPKSKAFLNCVAQVAAQRRKFFVCKRSHRLLLNKLETEL